MADKFNLSEGTQILKTSRITLRKFTIYDAENVYKNWAADEDVAKYTLWKPVASYADTVSYVSYWVRCYENPKYIHWAIVLNDIDEVIGSISISEVNVLKRSCNVGYTLGKEFWNRGIATEALKIVLHYLTTCVGFKKICGYCDIRNIGSSRVMEKADMKFVKRKNKYFFGSKSFRIDCNMYCYEYE